MTRQENLFTCTKLLMAFLNYLLAFNELVLDGRDCLFARRVRNYR